jgi:phage pi2 protein 07
MKDDRPYFIKEEEHKILVELAKDIFEELKKKEKISVHADELKEKIIERIGEKIKEIKKEKEERNLRAYGTNRIWKGNNLIWNWNYSVEDLLEKAKELFEEIYLFGRVKKFFMPQTGIGVIPARDQDGNLIYVFYDTKWTFVKKQG